MRTVQFKVVGEPVPQGSMRSFEAHGKIVSKPNNAGRLERWRGDIRSAARAVDAPLLEGPVTAVALFRFRRPASHRTATGLAKGAPAFPRQDIDKLTRAVLDALTGIVWIDDRQVTGVHTTKSYVLDDPSGVWIEIVEGTWQ